MAENNVPYFMKLAISPVGWILISALLINTHALLEAKEDDTISNNTESSVNNEASTVSANSSTIAEPLLSNTEDISELTFTQENYLNENTFSEDVKLLTKTTTNDFSDLLSEINTGTTAVIVLERDEKFRTTNIDAETDSKVPTFSEEHYPLLMYGSPTTDTPTSSSSKLDKAASSHDFLSYFLPMTTTDDKFQRTDTTYMKTTDFSRESDNYQSTTPPITPSTITTLFSGKMKENSPDLLSTVKPGNYVSRKLARSRHRDLRKGKTWEMLLIEPNKNDQNRECRSEHRYCIADDEEISTNLDSACSCLENCREYGDCCWEAPGTEEVSKSENIDDIPSITVRSKKVKMNCEAVFLEEIGDVRRVAMVSTCPFNDSLFKTWCETPEDEVNGTVSDILLVPVTSDTTNITYKNFVCALCHVETNYHYWNISLHCEDNSTKSASVAEYFLSNSSYIPNCINPEASYYISNSYGRIPKLSLNEDEVRNLHGCSNAWKVVKGEDPISSCPNDSPTLDLENRTLKELQYKCHIYNTPVKEGRGTNAKLYKNKFCALCNGVPPDVIRSKLQCYRIKNTISKKRKKTSVSFIPHTGLKSMSAIRISTLKLLNFGGLECPPYFDTKLCDKIHCGKLFTLANGQCIRKIDADANPESFIDSCPVVAVFNPSEYYKKNETDDYVYVVPAYNNREVIEGEYSIGKDGKMTICVETNLYRIFDELEQDLSVIGTAISVMSLAFKLTLYVVNQEGNNLASRLIFYLCLSLLIAQFLFLTGSYTSQVHELCAILGVATHYAYLASFFWMNVLTFDMWRTFSRKSGPRNNAPSKRKLLRYSLYAWGSPFLIIFPAVLLEWFVPNTSLHPYYGTGACWVSGRYASIVFFALPLAFVMATNIAMFVVTVYKISRESSSSKMARENTGKKDQIRLFLYLKLAMIMGITWVFGFVIPFVKYRVLRYLFITFNSSQGLFILVSFTRFRKRANPGLTASSSSEPTTTSREQTEENSQSALNQSHRDSSSFVTHM